MSVNEKSFFKEKFVVKLTLIEEIPAQTETKYTVVKRVVGGEKIVLIAQSRINMTHHYKESSTL